MAENDSKLNSEATAASGEPFDSFSLIVRMLRDVAGMELPGLELRSELPRGIPVTLRHDDGTHCLIGLDFETAAEAEKFGDGLAAFCHRDDARLFLKRPPTIIQDECGNCSGTN